jgi:pimeloyl-ACP methyl ester carboxylesterase
LINGVLCALQGKEALKPFIAKMSVRKLEAHVWELIDQHLQQHKVKPILPVPLSDYELQSLIQPCLLLIGDTDIFFDPQMTVRRAIRLLPNVQAKIILNAGHMLFYDQPECVRTDVKNFLSATAPLFIAL